MDSNADLELDAAQALFAARMLEAAVHHPGPWTMNLDGVEVEATKEISANGVVFTASFPEICHLEKPQGNLTISCDGVVMGMRRVSPDDHPGDTGFLLTWSVLSVKDPSVR